jgi:hypothetical protein
MKIDHECPQCGGPVTLDETDRFLSCSFCRVRLYLTARDYFRYYLSSSVPVNEETIFIPYWRLRGMYFKAISYKINKRVLDTSFLATGHDFIPSTLGLRTQALKLRFATSKMKNNFLRPRTPFKEVLSMFDQSHPLTNNQHGSNGVFRKAFIGETISMIYAPVYVKNNALYDGLLNRPMAQFSMIRAESFQNIESPRAWNIKFHSAQCPTCGWDLTGANNSVVLLCRNCDSAWHMENNVFAKTSCSFVTEKDQGAFYIPFWRMNVSVEGIDMKSYADLISLANLPRVIKKEWHAKELAFWTPAFTASPMVFLRLSKQLTVHQPSDKTSDDIPKADTAPVTLTVSEAAESVAVTIASLAAPKTRYFPLLPGMKIKLKDSALVYIPFTPKGSEFIQKRMNFSIQRNIFRKM